MTIKIGFIVGKNDEIYKDNKLRSLTPTKFLVDKQGNILERYAPTTKPEELNTIIEKLLS